MDSGTMIRSGIRYHYIVTSTFRWTVRCALNDRFVQGSAGSYRAAIHAIERAIA